MGTLKRSEQGLAVEALFFRYHTALCRFLTRMLRCEETAAEVAQEAYLRILRFEPRQAMRDSRAYLFQVAANLARDQLLRAGTRISVMDEGAPPETIQCPAPNAEAVVLGRERLRALSEAVDELPPRCREAFLMSRMDGLSNGEIAQRLGITRNMVEKHIIKAMLHCRRRLDAGSE